MTARAKTSATGDAGALLAARIARTGPGGTAPASEVEPPAAVVAAGGTASSPSSRVLTRIVRLAATAQDERRPDQDQRNISRSSLCGVLGRRVRRRFLIHQMPYP